MCLATDCVNCRGTSFRHYRSCDGSFGISWTWTVSAALASSSLRNVELRPGAGTELSLGAALLSGEGFSEKLQFGESRLLLLKVLSLRYTSDITADQFNPRNFQQRGQESCVKSSSSHGSDWKLQWIFPCIIYIPLFNTHHIISFTFSSSPSAALLRLISSCAILKQAGGWDFWAFCYQRLIQIFFPQIMSFRPVPGLRCMGSDVFCLMEKHFVCFVEAAYIPSAALELFVIAFLTPGAGQAGPLAHIWRWTVLKREVKCGSAAFKRGPGYFKHNTSFKVKRLSCNTLQRKRSSYF